MSPIDNKLLEKLKGVAEKKQEVAKQPVKKKLSKAVAKPHKKAAKQKQKQPKPKSNGRKLSITPAELAALTKETLAYANYGGLDRKSAGLRAASALNMSQLFGNYVGAALSKDTQALQNFTGKKGPKQD